MIPGQRFVVWDEPEYTAEMHIEDLDGELMHFFHLDVFYFSPRILRQMVKQWIVFREHVPVVLFCMGDEDDDKWKRFISHFGFQYLRDVPCTDGKTRRIFINLGPTKEALQQ
jgi:hypothetical protein